MVGQIWTLAVASNTHTHTHAFPSTTSRFHNVKSMGSELRLPMFERQCLMTLALALWPWEPVLQVLISKMKIILALISRSGSANELWQHMSSVSSVPNPESVRGTGSLWLSSTLWVFELLPFSRPIPDTLIPYQLASVVLGLSCQPDLTPCSLEWVGLEAHMVPNQASLWVSLCQPNLMVGIYHLDFLCLSFSPLNPNYLDWCSRNAISFCLILFRGWQPNTWALW